MHKHQPLKMCQQSEQSTSSYPITRLLRFYWRPLTQREALNGDQSLNKGAVSAVF